MNPCCSWQHPPGLNFSVVMGSWVEKVHAALCKWPLGGFCPVALWTFWYGSFLLWGISQRSNSGVGTLDPTSASATSQHPKTVPASFIVAWGRKLPLVLTEEPLVHLFFLYEFLFTEVFTALVEGSRDPGRNDWKWRPWTSYTLEASCNMSEVSKPSTCAGLAVGPRIHQQHAVALGRMKFAGAVICAFPTHLFVHFMWFSPLPCPEDFSLDSSGLFTKPEPLLKKV